MTFQTAIQKSLFLKRVVSALVCVTLSLISAGCSKLTSGKASSLLDDHEAELNTPRTVSLAVEFSEPWIPTGIKKEGYFEAQLCIELHQIKLKGSTYLMKHNYCVEPVTIDDWSKGPQRVTGIRSQLQLRYDIVASFKKLRSRVSQAKLVQPVSNEDLLKNTRFAISFKQKDLTGRMITVPVDQEFSYGQKRILARIPTLKNDGGVFVEKFSIESKIDWARISGTITLGRHTVSSAFRQTELPSNFADLHLKTVSEEFEKIRRRFYAAPSELNTPPSDSLGVSNVPVHFGNKSPFTQKVRALIEKLADISSEKAKHQTWWDTSLEMDPGYPELLTSSELQVLWSKALIMTFDKIVLEPLGKDKSFDEAQKNHVISQNFSHEVLYFCRSFHLHRQKNKEFLGDRQILKETLLALMSSTPVSYLGENGFQVTELLNRAHECIY
jgi:hypothetical protein